MDGMDGMDPMDITIPAGIHSASREGQGIMTLDGEHLPPGPGGEHGLENTGTADLRVLVFSVA